MISDLSAEQWGLLRRYRETKSITARWWTQPRFSLHCLASVRVCVPVSKLMWNILTTWQLCGLLMSMAEIVVLLRHQWLSFRLLSRGRAIWHAI